MRHYTPIMANDLLAQRAPCLPRPRKGPQQQGCPSRATLQTDNCSSDTKQAGANLRARPGTPARSARRPWPGTPRPSTAHRRKKHQKVSSWFSNDVTSGSKLHVPPPGHAYGLKRKHENAPAGSKSGASQPCPPHSRTSHGRRPHTSTSTSGREAKVLPCQMRPKRSSWSPMVIRLRLSRFSLFIGSIANCQGLLGAVAWVQFTIPKSPCFQKVAAQLLLTPQLSMASDCRWVESSTT